MEMRSPTEGTPSNTTDPNPDNTGADPANAAQKAQAEPIFPALAIAVLALEASDQEERRLNAGGIGAGEFNKALEPFSDASAAADAALIRIGATTPVGFAAKARYLAPVFTGRSAKMTLEECIEEFGPISTEARMAAIARDAEVVIESGEKQGEAGDEFRGPVNNMDDMLTRLESLLFTVQGLAGCASMLRPAGLYPVADTMKGLYDELRTEWNALHTAIGGAS